MEVVNNPPPFHTPPTPLKYYFTVLNLAICHEYLDMSTDHCSFVIYRYICLFHLCNCDIINALGNLG